MEMLWFGLLLGAVLAGVGWVQVRTAAERERLAALIERTRTSKVKDLRPDTLVEVEGKVRPRDTGPLPESPVSHTACVYWRLVVEEQVRRTTGTGKNRRTQSVWITRLHRTGRVPFVLDDGTGGVEVELEGADVGLATDAAGRSGFLNDPSADVAQALNRFGFATAGLVFNKTLRWSETYLQPGDPLYALGTFDGRRVHRGADGVLIASDRGQHKVHAVFDGAARSARRSGVVCLTLGGVAAGGGVVLSVLDAVL